MGLREVRCFVALVAVCGAVMPPAPGRAAGTTNDAFTAMRVEPVVPPRPAGNIVLRSIDGPPIRFGDFKGKVVVVGFLMAV